MSTTLRASEARIGSRILAVLCGALVLFALPVVTGALPSASAVVYRTWTLSGVTFGDGGTLTGTMVLGDDGSYYSGDLTTAGGDTATFGTTHYSGSFQELNLGGGGVAHYLWAPGFGKYLAIILPDFTGAGPGDTRTVSTQSWECTNCGAVRNVNAGTVTAGAVFDITAPTVTGSVDPPTPDGANGWYVGSPTVSFDITDAESAIDSQTGCGDTAVSTDTVESVYTCEATSSGGTSSDSVTIHRDATPPTFAPTVSRPVLWHGPFSAQAHATDATSGVDQAGCTGSTAVPGVAVGACEAEDLAGNSASTSLPFTVEYVMTPITLSKGRRAGQPLAVAVRLQDANGVPVPDGAAAALGCRLKLRIFGTQVKHACLEYSAKDDRFSTSRPLMRPGQATIRVWLTYPGSPIWTKRLRTITIKG